MSDDLATGLASTSNESTADSTPTVDATLDAAFTPSPEGTAPSEPSVQPEPAKEPAAATAQPLEQPSTELQKGEPPKERWDQILANARTKARDEALAEHQAAIEIMQKLRSDLPGTLSQLLEEAAGDDRFSEAIAAKAAALLNARRQRGKVDQEPQPDAVMRYEDGTTEPSYSPGQLRKWQEWRERQIERRLGEQFKPLQQLQQRVLQSEQQAQEYQAAVKVAQERGESWKAMPFYNDHKDAILKRQQEIYGEMQASGRIDPVNAPWTALQRAYSEVVTAQAIPKLQAKQTETLIASAAHKRAGSAADPAASVPATQRKPRTPDEALDQVFGGVFPS